MCLQRWAAQLQAFPNTLHCCGLSLRRKAQTSGSAPNPSQHSKELNEELSKLEEVVLQDSCP